jgi:hypothetical protein
MALTKSRFVLAAECATRLYYKGNPALYIDTSVNDEHLLALADGGFQVGALAQRMFPGGTLLDEGGLDERVRRTRELLAHEEVTIYEAAIQSGDLLALVDVLRKHGHRVDLLEVKAKSYSPDKDRDLRTQDGRIAAKYLPYLRDIAFQEYVLRHAHPELVVHPYLVLVDKSQVATVDGLNQRFRLRRKASGRSEVVVAPGTDAHSLGAPLLCTVDVHTHVRDIQSQEMEVGNERLPFPAAVQRLAEAHKRNEKIVSTPGRKCGDCPFRAAPDGARQSGFRECWKTAFGWSERDFDDLSVLDLFKLSATRKDDLFAAGVLKMRNVMECDLGDGPSYEGNDLTTKGRQALQVMHAREGVPEVQFCKTAFELEHARWTYPFNLIDFETATVALPFSRGRRPYEQIAFQFSHHLLHADGRVEHKTQFLDVTPGHFPNYDFVRALRRALSANAGTVFRWHEHENTVLRQIHAQLRAEEAPPPDHDELLAFIDSITSWKHNGDEKVHGPRTMVDLCDVAARLYFNHSTQGSSSLKKVLPALMQSSPFLHGRYAHPVYGRGGAIASLNFDPPIAWWQQEDGRVRDPYALLPPLFPDLSRAEQERLEWALPDHIDGGGAAMVAYARLQFEGIPEPVRESVRNALYKYCELDTLAMVMALEAWLHFA